MMPSGPGSRGRSERPRPAASRAAAAARSGSSGSRTSRMGEYCQPGDRGAGSGPRRASYGPPVCGSWAAGVGFMGRRCEVHGPPTSGPVGWVGDDDRVPTLTNLARRHTALTAADLDWLQSLVSDWQLLADLSFADLVLWAPLQDGSGWVVLAQMRPTTGPTTFHDDVVGSFASTGARPFLDAARQEQRICREGDPEWTRGALVRSPRVGDGLLRLGRSGKVSYASPNALSAYRRLGLTADLVGADLGPVTARLCAPDKPTDDALMATASGRAPRETEVEGNGSVVQLRAIPLVVNGLRTGALILVRDVTELRHRERELMTKDATIREIHHRVKNNLQTVAALLRLQARRLRAPEARAALDEAVRRVGSIAVVHETLSHVPEAAVDFDDIADRVAMMAGEVSAAEVRVIPKITGSFGQLSAAVATPLAMVLTELLQNALQHGFSHPGAAREHGLLEVVVVREAGRLIVTVADSGVGLPEGFDLASATSLGLQIVRTLVVGELGGRLRITPRAGGGTEAVVDLPVGHEPVGHGP